MDENSAFTDATPPVGSQGDAADRNLPTAHIRATPWRGWIWSVPLAAMILVGFLAIRTWLITGPTVTVIFPEVEGLNPHATGVFYRGVRIGRVEDTNLSAHGTQVTVKLSIDASAAALMHKETKFWISQPNILNGDLAGLISGPEIDMLAGGGPPAHTFHGLLRPPNLVPVRPGTTFAVEAVRLGNLHAGSMVLYRGMPVGEVLGWSYDAAEDRIHLSVFVRSPFDRRVTPATRFWRQGSFALAMTGGGVNLSIPPLQDILRGAIAFDQVGKKRGDQTPASFTLYADAHDARHVLSGPAVAFSASFDGSVGGLRAGAPVMLADRLVGRVLTVGLRYDAQRRRLVVPVTFVVYAHRLGLASRKGEAPAPTAVRTAMAALVSTGLRAQVESSNPLLGGMRLGLIMAGKPGEKTLKLTSDAPEIPTIPAGGLAGLLASANTIATKINAIPLQQIGQNLLILSQQLNRLAASPEITQSLAHLDKTLDNAQAITGNARGRVGPAITSLRDAAVAAAEAARTITNVTGGSLDSQQNIRRLVGELTRTARAIRTLANYLSRHPESLLQGRSR